MASVSPGINNLKGKKPCQFCGQYFKGIKIHISKAHPEQYRQSLLNAQTCIKNQDDQIDQSPPFLHQNLIQSYLKLTSLMNMNWKNGCLFSVKI